MSWGDALWGADNWGDPGAFSERMIARLLMFCQAGPKFVALVNALAMRTENLVAASRTVADAFDLDTAVGVQLDRLGEILQRPRFGMLDDRYRALLHIQIDLILSSTAGAETLLSVVNRLTGTPAPYYAEFYPAQFRIGAIVDPDDVILLQDLLRKAKGWGIYGGLVVYPDGTTPGEGGEGVLLGDLVGDEGVWSTVLDDRTFAARMTSTGADDIETATAGALDGTTHVPAFEARNFNGTTDRIDWLTSPLNLSFGQAFTVAAWVRIETLSGLRVIFTAASTGPAFAAIFRSNGDALEYALAYDAGTGIRVVSAAGVLSVGTWHHVVAVVPGTATAADHTLYVDGAEVSSYSLLQNGSGTPRPANGPWSIGGRIEADGNNTDGDVASIDVWPRILGPEEIAHLYAEGIAGGAFAGPPDEDPIVDNPGVGDLVTPTYALAYPTANLVTV